MSLKVTVIGCGHVGLVTAAGLAEIGHTVVGHDTDVHRLELLREGKAPFYEPGLQDLLTKHHAGRLHFEADPATAVAGADAAFVCVNTPPRPDGRLSLKYVEQAANAVAQGATGPIVIVEKSTVPVQTARRIADTIRQAGRGGDIEVASNPEFLREGRAVQDTLNPDRIVIGIGAPGRAEGVLRRLYAPIMERTGCQMIVTDLDTAETVKHACNSFLAMKISYINAVAALCEQVGADVETVSTAMGLDRRIGAEFLSAGVGYGGFCFPKDVSQFIAQAEDLGIGFGLLDEVRRINNGQRGRLVEKVRRVLWNLDGKTIAVWGLAFKPGTDDLRESPALDIIPALVREGATVRAFDPVAGHAAKEELPGIDITDDAMAAADGADALVVLTDWPAFAEVDLRALREVMRSPVVIDGRNLWSLDVMADAGYTYVSFGRPDVLDGEIRRR